MAKRQEAHALVALILREGRLVRVDSDQNVPVRDHRALGLAGGAGGVHQDGQLVGLARGDALLPQPGVACVVVAAQAPQRVEAHDAGVAQVAQAFHVEHDDSLQPRQPLQHLEHLVELLFVFDEHVTRAGVFEQIRDLCRCVGWIDAVGHPACAEHAEVGVQPLAVGVGLDRGHLARLEAERDEPHSHLAHDAARARPSPCFARRLDPSGAVPPASLAARRGARTSARRCRTARRACSSLGQLLSPGCQSWMDRINRPRQIGCQASEAWWRTGA